MEARRGLKRRTTSSKIVQNRDRIVEIVFNDVRALYNEQPRGFQEGQGAKTLQTPKNHSILHKIAEIIRQHLIDLTFPFENEQP